MDELDDLLDRKPGRHAPIDWRSLPVHPVAELFPMMSENELVDLAADIKTNGLKFPLVLDAEGAILVDGRNRRKACETANVAPHFIHLDSDEDPIEFILTANISRRHLTTGQIAMTIAQTKKLGVLADPLKPGPKGGRPRKTAESQQEMARRAGVDQKRISEALLIIEYAPELVDEVMVNTTKLDAAHRTAQTRKKAKEWRTEGMALLRKKAPEYAERVARDELSFEEARTLLNDREKAEEQVRQTVFQMLADYTRLVDAITKSPRICELPEWLEDDENNEAFEHYFKAGTAELEAAIVTAQEAVDVLKSIELPRRKTNGAR